MQTCRRAECLRIHGCRGNPPNFCSAPLQTQLKVILARRRRRVRGGGGVGVGVLGWGWGEHGGSPRRQETARMIDGVVVGL